MANKPIVILLTNLLILAVGSRAGAQGGAGDPDVDLFPIAHGDTISNGVPATGAGNIEVGGAQDVYTFQGEAGEETIFDAIASAGGVFLWQLETPDGPPLFDGLYGDRQATLPQTGTYTLAVRGATATSTGTYSFRILLAPAAQAFTIGFGDTVSNGVPAPGAGNLEAPGAVDVYTFDAVAGQEATFDILSGSNVQIGWRLEAPDNVVLFDIFLLDRQVVLPQSGTYTLTVDGNTADDFGPYSFRLLEGVITTPTVPLTPTQTSTSTMTPTETSPVTRTGTVTETPVLTRCVGDCDAGGDVTVDELVRGVNIALELQSTSVCPAFDENEGTVLINELVKAVGNLLRGCSVATSELSRS